MHDDMELNTGDLDKKKSTEPEATSKISGDLKFINTRKNLAFRTTLLKNKKSLFQHILPIVKETILNDDLLQIQSTASPITRGNVASGTQTSDIYETNPLKTNAEITEPEIDMNISAPPENKYIKENKEDQIVVDQEKYGENKPTRIRVKGSFVKNVGG